MMGDNKKRAASRTKMLTNSYK